MKYGICKCGCTKEEKPIYAKGLRKDCYWKHRREIKRIEAEARGETKDNQPNKSLGFIKTFKKRPKPISPFNDKKLKEMAEYRPLRDAYMKEHWTCQFKGCQRFSNDLHHRKPRKTHLCDVSIFMATCRDHHDYIHANHEESVQNGYLFDKFRPELFYNYGK